MGVFDCPDCGGTVSDRAAACPHCGAPVRAGVRVSAQAMINLHPRAEVCLTCHSVVSPVKEARGPAWVGWVLLPFYLLPGIVYFAWRSRTRRDVCPRCGGDALVPTTSVRGTEIISAASELIAPAAGHLDTCPSCLLPVNFPAGRRTLKCPYCTTNLTLTDSGIETD